MWVVEDTAFRFRRVNLKAFFCKNAILALKQKAITQPLGVRWFCHENEEL